MEFSLVFSSKIEVFLYTVPKLLLGKRWYILFLLVTLVFIVQVTKLVQFT
jgi:hypothetical protein